MSHGPKVLRKRHTTTASAIAPTETSASNTTAAMFAARVRFAEPLAPKEETKEEQKKEEPYDTLHGFERKFVGEVDLPEGEPVHVSQVNVLLPGICNSRPRATAHRVQASLRVISYPIP